MTNCDFTSTGLTEEAREMIGSTKWYLGGFGESPSYLWVLTSEWYNYERGTKVYSGHSTSWVGKIGLMYLSDYGYETSTKITLIKKDNKVLIINLNKNIEKNSIIGIIVNIQIVLIMIGFIMLIYFNGR